MTASTPAASLSEMLVTERLRLRLCEERDAAAIARACNNPAVARMTGTLVTPYLPDAAAFFILQQPSLRRRGLAHNWLAERDGKLVGCIGVFRSAPADVWEVGYWVAEPSWGRGFATEMVGCVVDATRPAPLAARVFADNPASLRVLQKCGFTVSGPERGHCMERQDWVDGWRLNLARNTQPRGHLA